MWNSDLDHSFPFASKPSNKRVLLSQKSAMDKHFSLHDETQHVSLPDCFFCQKASSREQFALMINGALSSKYSTSQNNFYARGVTDILDNARTPNVIKFKDLQYFDEETEQLRRLYRRNEHAFKMKMLSEYYKFHKHIPKIYHTPVCQVLDYYHNKQRRLEYLKVTKLLGEQKKQKEQGQKPPLSPDKRQIKQKFDLVENQTIADKVLADLELTQKNIKDNEQKPAQKAAIKNEVRRGSDQELANLFDETKGSKGSKSSNYNMQDFIKETMAINADQNRSYECSPSSKKEESRNDRDVEGSTNNTIQELNNKLREIINQSHSNAGEFETPSCLTPANDQMNNTISNLGGFLNYINMHNQSPELAKTQETKTTAKSTMQSELRSHLDEKSKRDIMSISPVMLSKKVSESEASERKLKLVPIDLVTNKQASIRLIKDKKDPTEDVPIAITAESKSITQISLSIKSNKQKPIPSLITKIKNFDDANKAREDASPSHVMAKSVTVKSGYQGPGSISTRRKIEIRMPQVQDSKQREAMTWRSKKNTKLTSESIGTKNQHLTERDIDVPSCEKKKGYGVEFFPPSPSIQPANSHREPRMSIEVKSFNKKLNTQRDPRSPDGRKMPNGSQTRLMTDVYIKSNPSLSSRQSIAAHLNAKEIYNFSSSSQNNLDNSSQRVWPQYVQTEADYKKTRTLHVIPENNSINFDPKSASRLQTPSAHKHTKSDVKNVKSHPITLVKRDNQVHGMYSGYPDSSTHRDGKSSNLEEFSPRQASTQETSSTLTVGFRSGNGKVPNQGMVTHVQSHFASVNESPGTSFTKRAGQKASPSPPAKQYQSVHEKPEAYYSETSTKGLKMAKIALPKMEDPKLVKSKSNGTGAPATFDLKSPFKSTKNKGKFEFEIKKSARVNEDYFEVLVKNKIKL